MGSGTLALGRAPLVTSHLADPLIGERRGGGGDGTGADRGSRERPTKREPTEAVGGCACGPGTVGEELDPGESEVVR